LTKDGGQVGRIVLDPLAVTGDSGTNVLGGVRLPKLLDELPLLSGQLLVQLLDSGVDNLWIAVLQQPKEGVLRQVLVTEGEAHQEVLGFLRLFCLVDLPEHVGGDLFRLDPSHEVVGIGFEQALAPALGDDPFLDPLLVGLLSSGSRKGSSPRAGAGAWSEQIPTTSDRKSTRRNTSHVNT